MHELTLTPAQGSPLPPIKVSFDGDDTTGDLEADEGNLWIRFDGALAGSLWVHRTPDGRTLLTLGGYDSAGEWIEAHTLQPEHPDHVGESPTIAPESWTRPTPPGNR